MVLSQEERLKQHAPIIAIRWSRIRAAKSSVILYDGRGATITAPHLGALNHRFIIVAMEARTVVLMSADFQPSSESYETALVSQGVKI